MWGYEEGIRSICIIVSILIGVAYVTLMERKVLAAIQLRRGPNEVGVMGILQPIADALKLIMKEPMKPILAQGLMYIISPVLAFVMAVLGFSVVNYGEGKVVCDVELSFLFILVCGSLGTYAILCSGWSSNSYYSFLGALRSTAQMLSYEVTLGILIIIVIEWSGSINISGIVYSQEDVWNIWLLWPIFIMFIVGSLAETARSPFDLPEGESELVSGYNIEYSSLPFALFFLTEYTHIIFQSLIISILFFGGWLSPLSYNENIYFALELGGFWLAFKVIFFIYLFIWVRGSVPRYRFDLLQYLGWKSYLPLTLGWLVFNYSFLIVMDWLPY